MKKTISFVIPCYRSEQTIRAVTDEIAQVMQQNAAYDYEIICVNDSSPDNVYQVLQKLASESGKIKVVNLAKNMGKHAAVLAGYRYATGDYIVNLDDDFQCPTQELWLLLKPLEEDKCDFVTANYPQKKQAAWKNLGSNINMRMSEILLAKPKGLRCENFCAMKRFVMDEVIKYDNPYPYLEGLILRVTNRIATVEMEERSRADSNTTGFTFVKSIALLLNGFTAFSVKPLRISTAVGVATAAAGFVMGIVLCIRKLMNPSIAMGFTSLAVIMLFLGGLNLISLGLIGEYIGRIYISLNKSPQYVVKETVNLSMHDRRAQDSSKEE